MGLDGISVNQLRITPEFNSSELNNSPGVNTSDIKIVDGLSSGQRVDPDKEHEHEENNYGDFSDADNKEDENNDTNQDVTKYDLSDSNKYIVKLDDKENKIMIIEKATNQIIQEIDANELSRLVSYSTNSCGSIINKKF